MHLAVKAASYWLKVLFVECLGRLPFLLIFKSNDLDDMFYDALCNPGLYVVQLERGPDGHNEADNAKTGNASQQKHYNCKSWFVDHFSRDQFCAAVWPSKLPFNRGPSIENRVSPDDCHLRTYS